MTRPAESARGFARGRIVLFQSVAAALLAFLLLSFWELQVLNSQGYAAQAEENRVRSLPLLAPRGDVVDRRGRPLAGSRVVSSGLIHAALARPGNLERIAARLGLDARRLARRVRDAQRFGRFGYIPLKERLSVAEIAFVEANRTDFPEVAILDETARRYSGSGVAAHLLGYVSEASTADLNSREFLLSGFGATIGKSGIERRYNQWLTGRDGQLLRLVDSRGRSLETLSLTKAVAGNPLKLTIDLDIQVVAELGLSGRKGAVVALDPRNGEILAMASSPVYDPNMFVAGMSTGEWQQVHADPQEPLLNRAIQGTWAMGSVFKPIHALAGLEAGVLDESFTVSCAGGLAHGGSYFGCHNRNGHGRVNLVQAIALSCDVFFYRLGQLLGIETIARYARLAGLGTRTRVDLPDEVPGLVPSTRWKVQTLLQPWHPGETIVVSIGQGAMAVTPIQAAHAIGGLAVGGAWHQPRLVSREQLARIDPSARPAAPRRRDIDREHLELLRKGMWTVVNGAGTGRQARLADMDVCGKTGTSQRVSNETRLRYNRPEFEDDAWFVGFAPCEAPEIVVAALIENGKHSYHAAALVRDVLAVWALHRERSAPANADRSLAAAHQPLA